MQVSGPLGLMLLAFLGLAALGGSGLLLVRAQDQKKALDKRIEFARSGRRSSAPATAQPIRLTRAAPRESRGMVAQAAALLGFEADKPEQHPAKWWIVLVVAAVGARVVSMFVEFVIGGVGTATIPFLFVAISRAAFGWGRDRYRGKLLQQFPDALTMIVRSVRVGIPVSEAIRLVGLEAQAPTNREFQTLASKLAVGASLEDALKQVSARNGVPEYRFFATALALQSQTGGPLGETLDSLADVIRKRIALRERGVALASEAKTSSIVLGVLPFFATGALFVISPAYIMQLFTTATGHRLIGVAAMLLGMGAGSMRLLIKKSLS